MLDELEEQTTNYLQANSSRVVSSFDAVWTYTSFLVDAAAGLPSVHDALRGGDVRAADEALYALHNSVSFSLDGFSLYANIFILDANYFFVAGAVNRHMRSVFNARGTAFTENLSKARQGQSHISDAHFDRVERLFQFWFTSPIIIDGEFYGLAVIPLNTIVLDLFLDRSIYDLGINTNLADGAGTIFYSNRTSYIGIHVDDLGVVDALGYVPMREVFNHESAITGIEKVAYITEFPEMEWTVISFFDAEDLDNMLQSVVIALIPAVLATIFLSVVLVLIIHRSLKPLVALAATTRQVARGNFNINRISHSKVSNDEIGQLTSDVYSLTDMIQSLIHDFSRLHEEVEIKGNISSYRIDTTPYSGEFKIFCEKANALLDNFTSVLSSVFDVLAAIGNGNFDIEVPQLPGEKAVINQHFDEIVRDMKAIHGEITRLFQNAAEGILDVEADANKYKGSWRELISEMNQLLSTVADPLAEIEISLAEMAKGNFETPVKGEYKGAFDALKQTVNATGEDLVENVNEITSILQALAIGDLTVPIDRERIDSYNPIKEALISILKALNHSMWTIQNTAAQVQEGAEQMSLNAASLADGTNRQAHAISELNETLESINEKTQRSAEAAKNMNQRSQQSTESAKSGSDDMQKMISTIESIKSSSANITKITGVIQGIAFQTNLLALNASVEAARAGEHGKGFSVVAEEVRNLATRSQAATKESTAEIEESLRRVDEGMSVAQSTATSLNTIVEHVQEVSDLISQITGMAQEQAEAVEQVYQGVNEISQVVQANSATSEECAAASQELSAQAELLKQSVAFFTVRPPRDEYSVENDNENSNIG